MMLRGNRLAISFFFLLLFFVRLDVVGQDVGCGTSKCRLRLGLLSIAVSHLQFSPFSFFEDAC
jgi:hypothetical protein